MCAQVFLTTTTPPLTPLSMFVYLCAGISDYYYNSVNAVFWPDADSDREPLVTHTDTHWTTYIHARTHIHTHTHTHRCWVSCMTAVRQTIAAAPSRKSGRKPRHPLRPRKHRQESRLENRRRNSLLPSSRHLCQPRSSRARHPRPCSQPQ
jgi:hypothetical protein